MYLYEQNKSNEVKNEEVFSLLWYVITGNPVGPPLGDIIDVLGQKVIMWRI